MSDIQQGLLIAAIGMGLVFAVIIFLWGIMALMMRVTSSKKEQEQEAVESAEVDAPLVPEMQTAEGQRRAVAAAVGVGIALARSKAQKTRGRTQNGDGGMSPWDAFNRTRQLQHKNTRG